MSRLTASLLNDLVGEHGIVTHVSFKEGGPWCVIQQFGWRAIVNTAPHALRFLNGREWDEINGIRPIESPADCSGG